VATGPNRRQKKKKKERQEGCWWTKEEKKGEKGTVSALMRCFEEKPFASARNEERKKEGLISPSRCRGVGKGTVRPSI